MLQHLDTLPSEVVSRFLGGRTRRYTLFAPSTRRSVEAFITYCNIRSKEAVAPGRKSNDALQLLTEEVVRVFEFWVGRGFKKNLNTDKDGFVAHDARCIALMLRGISSTITEVQVRSALKMIPARGTKNPKKQRV